MSKNPKNILLIGYNWPLTAVRLPHLLRRAGNHVDAVFPKGFTVGNSKYLNRCFWTPANRKSFIQELNKVLDRKEHDVFVLTDEAVLKSLSQEPDLTCLKKMGCLPLDPEKLQSLYDKVAFTKLAQKESWPVPESETFTTPEDAIEYGRSSLGFPFIVKGALGAGGASVQIFRSESDTRSISDSLKKNGRCALQRYITGDVGVTEAIYDRGKLIGMISSIKFRKRGGETSPSCSRKMVYHPKMAEVASRIGETFGYSGFFGFDWILEAATNEIKVIELHGRAPSGYNLGQRIEVNFGEIVKMIGSNAPDQILMKSEYHGSVYSIFPQYLQYFEGISWEKKWATFREDFPSTKNKKFYDIPDLTDLIVFKSYREKIRRAKQKQKREVKQRRKAS
ncbi:MAG: ATP-grasp domain-containing protein [Verrucomicrobiota bacterium]